MSDTDVLPVTVPPAAPATTHQEVNAVIIGTSASMVTVSGSILAKATDARASARVDGYMRNRLMPAFGQVRLEVIDHGHVSAWFDAASVDKPGAANRAIEALRAMLATARQWGKLEEDVPDACANIVRNPRRPVARFLDRAELERLGKVLDRHKAEHP